MRSEFSLVVLGTGSAGSGAAYQCRSAGWDVAVIDSRPFGGTCALRGCDPKKVLVGAAELVDWHRRMQGYGVSAANVRIDWPALMQFKRTFTDPVPTNREQNFTKSGIKTFHGAARFIDKCGVLVGNETLTGRFVLVATGAKPAALGIPEEQYVTTSDQFLELDQLPLRIIFIGGGYVSFEFAHIAARGGSKVTILHQGARPLFRFDPDLVDRLVLASAEAGIKVELNTQLKAVESTSAGLVAIASTAGTDRTFEGDIIVHGAGRVADIDSLDLDQASVRYTSNGIIVNEFLQSVSNPSVYAAGDCDASGPPLTPVASREGEVAAENMLKGNHIKVDYTGVPSVVFTIPPLASVGLQEAEARNQGLEFQVKYQDTSGWYAARRINERFAGHKILVERESGRILGAHLLGTHADEVINLFGLAIKLNLRSKELTDLFYAYPTNSSNIPYMV